MSLLTFQVLRTYKERKEKSILAQFTCFIWAEHKNMGYCGDNIGYWCNLNLKIISSGSRTRDFTVVGQYNYRYAVNAFIKFDESIHGVVVVILTNDREIPGSIPGRYNLQIKITSVCLYQPFSRIRYVSQVSVISFVELAGSSRCLPTK